MVEEIDRNTFLKLKEQGAKIVDALSEKSYQKEHIKGAINIPVGKVEEKAEQLLDKENKIVTYCAGFECEASTKAADKLSLLGFKNIFDYKGGLEDYKKTDLPLEGAEVKN